MFIISTKKAILLFLALFLYTNGTAQDIRDIHYLEIIDSERYEFKLAANSIHNQLYRQVKEIAEKLGIDDIHEYYLNDEKFTKEEINRTISNELKYSKGDIVIVAYLGHGYRENWQREDEYPILYIEDYQHSMHYGNILNDIFSNKPSVVISLINSCNKIVTNTNNPPKIGGNPNGIEHGLRSFDSKDLSSKFLWKKLLAPYSQERGEAFKVKSIELMSSAPNTSTNIDKDGGPFFQAVTEVIDDYLYEYQENKNWNSIIDKIGKLTSVYINKNKVVYNQDIKEQTPLCKVGSKIQSIPIIRPTQPRRSNEEFEYSREVATQLALLKREHQQNMKKLKDDKIKDLSEARRNRTSKREKRELRVMHKSILVAAREKFKRDKKRLKQQKKIDRYQSSARRH